MITTDDQKDFLVENINKLQKADKKLFAKILVNNNYGEYIKDHSMGCFINLNCINADLIDILYCFVIDKLNIN